MKKKTKVSVIGGGLGGMSAAILLADAGCEVDLFEKNEKIGGKLNVLKKDGFSFDLGPSIFTLPQIFRRIFEVDGRKMEDYFELRRLDPQWRNFFEDGSVIDLYEDRERMRQELNRLGSYGAQANHEYDQFVRYSQEQYRIVDRGYFEQGLDGFWEFLRFYGLRGASKLDYLHSMSDGIARFFTDPRLRAIFEYFIKYVGSSAEDAPGFMNLMPNVQLEFGLWYVVGGLYRLAEGFERRMKEAGVRIHLDSEVVEVEKAGNQVNALKIRNTRGGETREYRHTADSVVCNMEVIPAYQKLFGEGPKFLKKLERFEPACSGIVLHLGTRKVYPQLAHHCFFYSRDQKSHFDRVFQEKKLPNDPTIYLVAPTRTDPSQAPEGCDNIKILPHIPYLNEKSPYTYEDCLELKERVLDKLERMGLTDLRKNIIVEDFWTPFDIEKKYYSNRGSIYGVVSDRKRNFAFKAPKRSTKYGNLYFTGGSVNPGGGMPMVVLSGQHVARMILSELT